MLSHALEILLVVCVCALAAAKPDPPSRNSFHSQGFLVSSCTACGVTKPLILGKASNNYADILESRNGTILVRRWTYFLKCHWHRPLRQNDSPYGIPQNCLSIVNSSKGRFYCHGLLRNVQDRLEACLNPGAMRKPGAAQVDVEHRGLREAWGSGSLLWLPPLCEPRRGQRPRG